MLSGPGGGGRWVMAQSSDAGFPSPEGCFIYPFTVGWQGASNWYITTDTTQITTPAGIFNRTVHTAVDTTQFPQSQTFTYLRHMWRTRGVGLTKASFSVSSTTSPLSGTTWELIDYNIVP